jgi:hypothetical protein
VLGGDVDVGELGAHFYYATVHRIFAALLLLLLRSVLTCGKIPQGRPWINATKRQKQNLSVLPKGLRGWERVPTR